MFVYWPNRIWHIQAVIDNLLLIHSQQECEGATCVEALHG
jgi:hypothetical protein